MRSALPARTTAFLHVRLLGAVVVAAVLFASSARADTGPSFANVCNQPSRVGYAGCFAIKSTVVWPQTTVSPDSTPAGYGPADLQSAYSLPSNAGLGTTVAIVDAYDDPNAASDLNTYRSQYGLPACTSGNGCFSKVNQSGGTSYPAANGGWASEISLDLDMVSATCPNCHILLVEANDNSMVNLGTAVDEAVALGAKYVSNSYGGSEWSGEASFDSYYDHPGVAITVSAGDSGYGAAYPAASPYVTAVGGTTLTADSSLRGFTETAWLGTGSGCSAYEPKPAWQTDSGCANRTIADVSAVADPNTGVAVYDSYPSGGWTVYGGTSASSPIIASAYALAGTPAVGSNPASYPYADSLDLNDPAGGSNGSCSPSYLCNAGPGFDGPTGLGTPAGVSAFTQSSAPPPAAPTGLAATPVSANEIDLSWDAAAVDHYVLQRSTNGTTWTTVASIAAPTTTYDDTSLQPSTSYIYQLEAVVSGVPSAPSAQASATTPAPPPTNQLQVTRAGSGAGSVGSSPAGITCGATCSAGFTPGAQVVLTAAAHGSSTFTGWSGGGCSGVGTCSVTMSQAQAVTATFVPSAGPTSVSGSIASDTTWTALHSPYLLTGGITVQGGATLTINPGVTVIAQGHYTLQVNGRLLAAGLQTQPISFTCAAHTAGCWTGIALGASETNSVLDHVEIAYATTGLSTASGPTWTLSNSYVHDSTTGASVSGSALCCAGTLTGNLITHNTTGASVYYALTEFDDNTITANGTGVSLLGQGDEIHDNNIQSNTTWNASACAYPGNTTVDAGSNWWGTTNAVQIAASICDQADTPGQPLITTAPTDSSAVAAAPQVLTITPAGPGTGDVTSDLDGIDCGTQCWALYGTGQAVTLTATANAGSSFTGWSGGGCSGTSTCQVTLNAATTVHATFVPVYTLTLSRAGSGSGSITSSPAGINCGVTCHAQFSTGTPVTLTATPDAGSRFTGWSGSGCSGAAQCQVTMTGAANVTATFVRVFQLSLGFGGAGTGTVHSQPGGIACTTDCSATFNVNEAVTLTAAPSAGVRFAGWSGACTGTGTCHVTMSTDRLVTATFVPIFHLSVTKTGVGIGTVKSQPAAIDCGTSCAANIDVGTVVTLTATSDAYSVFVGWSGAGCSGTGTCQVTMNTAYAVTANFAALSRPDGLIAYGNGSFAGTGVFNTSGAGQTRTASTARGHVATFRWKIVNDAIQADTLRLTGTGPSAGFAITYLIGTTNVSKPVIAGTLARNLGSHASVIVTVRITVAQSAKLKAVKAALLTAASSLSGRKDAVLTRVTATS